MMDEVELLSEQGFYCDRCVGSVEHFFNEAQLNATKSSKYKALYKQYKHGFLHYKNLLKKLQFKYDEVNAVKDALEDKLSCIAGDVVTHLLIDSQSNPKVECNAFKTGVDTAGEMRLSDAQAEAALRSELKTFKDQSDAKIAELQSQLNEIKVQFSLIMVEKNALALQLEEAAQRHVTLNATHTGLLKEKDTLVGDNAKMRRNLTILDTETVRFQRECNEQTRRLREERDKLKETLVDFEKLKQLEFDLLMRNAQATQFADNQQIKAMSEQANASEQLVESLKTDLALVDEEKSELQSRLNQLAIEHEKELTEYREELINGEEILKQKIEENEQLNLLYEQLGAKFDEAAERVDQDREVLELYEAKIAELTQENEQLQELCQASSLELINAQKRVCGLEAEYEAVKTELDEARETCVRHEQTESTLCSEFSSFKDQAKEKIAELQSQLYEINLKENLSDFKAEKAKYLKERKLFKEEHKENKQLKNDMIKLNETVNEMRETNEFLATQINSLTQHIFELNSDFPGNKENCGQSNDDVVPKLSNRLMETPSATFGVNKRVAELGGTTPQSRRIVVADSSLLNPVDMNSSGNFATPSRSPARIKTINSPSSIVKNQSPCTFQ